MNHRVDYLLHNQLLLQYNGLILLIYCAVVIPHFVGGI